MLFYPQLSSGSCCQFPFVRREVRRVIRNRRIDGGELTAVDGAAAEAWWDLEYRGLSFAEWLELEQFFHAVEGRLGSFVFLDPTDNLLVWSDDLSRSAWTRGPWLEFRPGVTDPFGGTQATRVVNQGASTQRVEQALDVPSWYQYCLSVWVRTDRGAGVTLFGRSGDEGVAKTVSGGGEWRRVSLPVKLGGDRHLVCFGLEIESGQSVEVYGWQVEAQAGASRYKKTRSRSGVYREARFAEDCLETVAEGPNCVWCRVRIVALI